MKHWRDCNCTGAIFVQHIINHLRVGEEVVCKICEKTVVEIAVESPQPVIEADAEKCTVCEDKPNSKYVANYCFKCGRRTA